jgi:hypothetical protein
VRIAQAAQLNEVLAREGPDFLATWRAPMLTWPELQALKAEGEAGQALEAPPPGAGSALAARCKRWCMRARTGCA